MLISEDELPKLSNFYNFDGGAWRRRRRFRESHCLSCNTLVTDYYYYTTYYLCSFEFYHVIPEAERTGTGRSPLLQLLKSSFSNIVFLKLRRI